MSKDNLYRILAPSEFVAMKEAPLPSHFQVSSQRRNIWLDTLLFTGMRYEELLYLDAHWEQFDAKNNAITLPKAYTKTNMDRTVHLTPAYSKTLAQYLREFKVLGLPARNVMNANLKRWWQIVLDGKNPVLGSEYLWYPTAKTFRKSWETWLIFAGYDSLLVALSQGHTQTIQIKHYANMSAVLKSEAEQVRELTKGWMT